MFLSGALYYLRYCTAASDADTERERPYIMDEVINAPSARRYPYKKEQNPPPKASIY